MGESNGAQTRHPGNPLRASRRRRVVATVGLVGLSMAALMAFSVWWGESERARHEGQHRAIRALRIDAAMAHIRISEILAGDRDESVEAAWAGLSVSERAVRALLDGGEIPQPTESSDLRAELQALLSDVAGLWELAEERVAASSGAGPGSEIDAAFDAAFAAFLARHDRTDEALHTAWSARIARVQLTQALLIVLVLIGTGAVAWLLMGFERRRAEAQATMAVSEARFRSFFDNVPVYCYLVSEDGSIEDVNRAALTALGYERDELVGESVLTTVYASSPRGKVRAAFEESARTGQVSAEELSVVTKDGKERTVLANATTIRDAEGNIQYHVGVQQDITERKRAEERALRMGKVVEESLNEVYIFDVETLRFVDANRGARRNLGYSAGELRGMTPVDLKPEFTAESFAEVIEPLRSGAREATRFTTYHRRKDGSLYPVEVHIQLLRGGAPVFCAIILDITERKRAEEALKRAAARLEKAQRVAGMGFLDVDLASNEMIWSDEVYRLYGVDPRERTATLDLTMSLCHPDDLERVEESLDRAIAGIAPQHIDHRMVRPDGETIWVHARSDVEKDDDGRPVRLLGTVVDITGRKEAEEELWATRERLALALRGGELGTWDWNIETGHVVFNERWAEMLGYTLDEIEPHVDTWEKLVHPDDLPEVMEALNANLEGRTASYETEHRMRAKSDEWVWVLDKGQVVERAEDGSPLRAVGTHLDVTRRMELADQLRQAQKMEAVGQLTSGIAHDFNNVLSVVLMNAQLVAEALDAGELPVRSDVAGIEDAARRANSVTRQLLGFSRQAELNPAPTDLAQVTSRLSSFFERLLPGSIEVSIRHEGTAAPVEVDPASIEQTLLNLVTNAGDAMPEGGTLEIEVAEVELGDAYVAERPGVKPGRYVRVSVTDTGTGMDQETRERIFEPFYSTKEPGKGTGLGLAMVHGLVKQQGGHVHVYSEPGKGTTVKLYFPVIEAEAREPAGWRAGAEPRAGGTETILLVEDEDAVRATGRQALERYGYTVLEAGNGRKGLELYREHAAEIDLVISDLVMPEMGGAELYQALQAEASPPPIILASGYAGGGAGSREGLPETVPFVTKPWTLDSLLGRVLEVLDGPGEPGMEIQTPSPSES